MGRRATVAQKAAAEARREGFRKLAAQVAAMSDTERAALADRMAGAVTIEGHRLSPRNAALAAMQRESATLLGGFQQWIRAGRVVRKGEHGIMIWAPTQRADKAHGPAKLEGVEMAPEDKATLRFIPITVFDIAQTDALGEQAAA